MRKVGEDYFHDESPGDVPALRADIEDRRESASFILDEGAPDLEIERTRGRSWFRATWTNRQDQDRLTYLIAAVGHFPIREEGYFQVLGGDPVNSVAKRISIALYGKPGKVSVKILR